MHECIHQIDNMRYSKHQTKHQIVKNSTQLQINKQARIENLSLSQLPRKPQAVHALSNSNPQLGIHWLNVLAHNVGLRQPIAALIINMH